MKNLNLRRMLFGASLAGLSLLGSPYSASAISNMLKLRTAFETIYCSLLSILPPVGMVLVILAAVIYAAGQVGGAEFRTSAGRWATALIVGAVLSLVLILLLPVVLSALDPTHADQYAINCV